MRDYPIDYTNLIELDDEVNSLEQIGTKEKGWLQGRRFLFKRGRPGTGEDWAEVVTSALCSLMGLPHASYCFAHARDGKYGVLTKSIVPPKGRLVHGNELMKIYKDYDPHKKYNLKEHQLGRVYALLLNLDNGRLLPEGVKFNPPLSSLRDDINPIFYFACYLLLDTLIGNQDRHHENWGFIVYNRNIYLAETFDHASSLGRNDSDEKKIKILNNQCYRLGISEYCAKALTPFYSSTTQKRLKTLEAYKDFIKRAGIEFDEMLQYLEPITRENVMRIFEELPKNIPNAPTINSAIFAVEMIMENKKRIMKEG